MDDLEQGPRSTGTGSASPFALTNAFQWGDAESDEDGAGNAQEDTRLLQEFRAMNQMDQGAAKVYNTREQPAFHNRNKTFVEKYCTCCISGEQSTDLTRFEVSPIISESLVGSIFYFSDFLFPQIYRFYEFRDTMLALYSETNSMHESALRQLYLETLAVQDKALTERGQIPWVPEDLCSERWTEIGFQGSNPRTDFRAGGYLSLLGIIYSVRNIPAYLKLMCDRMRHKEDWFTAISIIGLSSTLATYLHIVLKSRGGPPPDHLRLLSGRRAFKTFAALNSQDKSTFFELVCGGLTYLFELWCQATSSQ